MTDIQTEITKPIKYFGHKELFLFIVTILLPTDLAILLDIPFLRQILGFILLAILPGLLILQILKLNKIDFLEKFVLSWGLSISFLMFFGLLVNNLSLGFGYETPLSTISLLISLNIAFVMLAIIGYKINNQQISLSFSLKNINLNASEKAFLIVPVVFPALSIFGMHVMNTTDNNIILMFMLFLIPIYVAFVCFFNHKFPKRLYPVVIFLISISLLLLLSLRSNHIIGCDTHSEYYFFSTTLHNLHWSILGHSSLDACLSISLLPAIYQSILNIPSEFLQKILYSLLNSIFPLVVYILSKRYVGEFYGFLASCFFIFQRNFLWTAAHARANIAMLFFAFAMMTLFNDKIDPLKKRILFIVFMASCIVSHYSTTYIFFFIMLGAFIGMEILSKKYTFKKVVSLTIVILFFALLFFWYSQVTEAAFSTGVGFIEKTFKNLHDFFIVESRGTGKAILGKDIMQKGIPHKIEFVFTWLTFVLIGIGLLTLIRRYKEMSFPELKFKKPDFLKDKFEVLYFVIALACAGTLIAVIAIPHIATGYGLDRAYPLVITILSVFFVIGGIIIAKYVNQFIAVLRGKVLLKNTSHKPFRKHFLSKERTCAKKETLFAKQKAFTEKRYRSSFGKPFLGKKRFGENASEVQVYFIILLVLIPYFFGVTGVTYEIFGVPRTLILSSEGRQYDSMYINDHDAYGVKWLRKLYEEQNNPKIYVTTYGGKGLTSQRITNVDYWALKEHKKIDGYIYLGYYNIITCKLVDRQKNVYYNMTEYSDIFIGKSRIYDNGGAEVWR